MKANEPFWKNVRPSLKGVNDGARQVLGSRVVVKSLILCALLMGGSHLSVAETLSANSCWPDDALKAKRGEHRIQRKRHAYSQPRDTPSLAPYTPIPPELRGAIRRVTLPEDKKWIALTLDFCEQPGEIAGYDGAIIDYLREHNIPATLFVGGKWMRTHPERTQQLMADPRFELANHAEAHRNLRRLSGSALDREISGPQEAYETLRTGLEKKACFQKANTTRPIAKRLSFFRFPYGACNATALNAVNDAGLLAIQWDFSSWDSARSQTANRIARRMVREVRPGSIVLAHGNGRGYHTANALRIAVPQLRKKGFKFVTVSQLLAAGEPVITQRCYNFRPGDTDHYDRPFRRRVKKSTSNGWNLFP